MNDLTVTDAPCPHCNATPITTARKIYFARGFLIAWSSGQRPLIGCTSCVRKKIGIEVLKQATYGWFSYISVFLTIGLVPINIIRMCAVKADPKAVTEMLDEMGIPTLQHAERMADALYTLSAAMINADGHADEAEIATAESFCTDFLSDFDRDLLFNAIQSTPRGVRVNDAIVLLGRFLDGQAKRAVLWMLSSIAAADGSAEKTEHKLWKQTAKAFGADGKQIKELWAEDTQPPLDGTHASAIGTTDA